MCACAPGPIHKNTDKRVIHISQNHFKITCTKKERENLVFCVKICILYISENSQTELPNGHVYPSSNVIGNERS